MNKIFSVFITTFMLNISLSTAQNQYDYLVYPDTAKRIIIVSAKDSIGKTNLLSGVETETNDEFAKEILKELNFPYHRTLIRLNQCSRNLAKNAKGPNVLFLSKNEGGFARQGLALMENDKLIEYPKLNFVDLVVRKYMLENGALTIYSHELGHVMMNNVWPDFPDHICRKHHVSMGVTDYYTAFTEGWGIQFQRLAYNNVSLYQNGFNNKFNYKNINKLWHSSVDENLRIKSVSNNSYIYRKLLPGNINIDTLSKEDIILLEHTSPIFDFTKIRNAQQMLSCEGVIATLFYSINTNNILQSNYQDNKFYRKFLLSEIPDGVKPKDIFTPFENVILKNFWVWNKIKVRDFQQNQILIEFIKEWCNLFPEDKDEIIKIFYAITIGKTINNELGELYEKVSWYGSLGRFKQYRKFAQLYLIKFKELQKEIIEDISIIGKNIGPELWIENPQIQVRTTLWNDRNKKNLQININTASLYEIATFNGFDQSKAKKFIEKRDEKSYFNSFEEAAKFGFKFK